MMSDSTETGFTVSEVAPRFLLYAHVELRFAPQSIQKYADCLHQVQMMLGDVDVRTIQKPELMRLKAAMLSRRNGECRQAQILLALRRFLLYCRAEESLDVFAPEAITVPRRSRREVMYLSVEEIDRFISAIRLKTVRGSVCVAAVRFRALVEILLGSAMRISEVLSLNRSQIDLVSREAKIIGKGNKERVVFFTKRSLFWLARYLELRDDNHAALFVRQDGRERLKRPDIWRFFARYRRLAKLEKRVTPHILRHSAATRLLFNGCPVGHIKDILGHARLETTCRYYLGLDHVAAKKAHERFLTY